MILAKSLKKITVGKFILSKDAHLQPATLLKYEFLQEYFSRILPPFYEHLFQGISFSSCLHDSIPPKECVPLNKI